MKWEYRVSDFDYGQYIPERWLNEKGKEGWELVAIMGTQFVFKRLIQEGV